MSKITKEIAVKLADAEFWTGMTPEQIAAFQLAEPLLCMPFAVFHEAVERALGRPVWTHEFADAERLRNELAGTVAPPTLDDILAMIPTDKRIVMCL